MTGTGAFALDPERYNKRLAIVVPYRDRQEHLNQFLPHMLAYFQRDKLDRNIQVTINIIEQTAGRPFNRGKLNNTGFALVKDESDYVSFHDVDYLPIWADYSWTPAAARLIWHGLTLKEDRETFFGAVNVVDNRVFAEVNGFPNCYWGWGPEDFELGRRCRMKGYDFEKRDGTYQPLPHKHAGFAAPGIHTDEAQQTHQVFRERQNDLEGAMNTDGLNTLEFRLLNKAPLAINGANVPGAWRYLVNID